VDTSVKCLLFVPSSLALAGVVRREARQHQMPYPVFADTTT
jgi:hypothetical protein